MQKTCLQYFWSDLLGSRLIFCLILKSLRPGGKSFWPIEKNCIYVFIINPNFESRRLMTIVWLYFRRLQMVFRCLIKSLPHDLSAALSLATVAAVVTDSLTRAWIGIGFPWLERQEVSGMEYLGVKQAVVLVAVVPVLIEAVVWAARRVQVKVASHQQTASQQAKQQQASHPSHLLVFKISTSCSIKINEKIRGLGRYGIP